jgi:hypothetical protein
LSIDLPDLPQAVAWVESLPIAPVIGTAPNPQTGGLVPEYLGIITEIYAPGLSVAANGSVTGQVPAAPEPGAPYGVYPIVSNVVNEQVDVDSVKAILSDEATRKSHVDRLASIASGANFAGIALDYGVPSSLKAEYATLVEDLAAALHANGKQLIVALYATGLPGQPAPVSLDESGYDLTRIGRAADTVQIKTVARPVLDWAATKMARHKLQPVISAASGKTEGESFTSIPFADAVASLAAQATTPISTTAGTSLTLRLNASLTLDQADGSYRYASDEGETPTAYTLRTAASLAAAINALSDLRLRGVVIRDIQDLDAAPNLLQPIQAYRQQTIVIGSSELNVNWTIKAADGSTVLNETRPLATADLTWTPARDGVFTVTAGIASVSRDVAKVTVGAGGTTTATSDDSPTGRCYNAGYVADVSVPDNTRFARAQQRDVRLDGGHGAGLRQRLTVGRAGQRQGRRAGCGQDDRGQCAAEVRRQRRLLHRLVADTQSGRRIRRPVERGDPSRRRSGRAAAGCAANGRRPDAVRYPRALLRLPGQRGGRGQHRPVHF